MSIRKTTVFVALLTLCVGGSVVLAEPLFKNNLQSSSNADNSEQRLVQNSEGRREQKGKSGYGRVLQELNLSDQQQQQLEEIKQKYQGQMQPLRENMKTLRQELKTMMSGTASNNEIRSKHQQLATLHQQMGNLRFESMLEMREILTPEQRSKFSQIMEQRRENSGQRFRDPADTGAEGTSAPQ